MSSTRMRAPIFWGQLAAAAIVACVLGGCSSAPPDGPSAASTPSLPAPKDDAPPGSPDAKEALPVLVNFHKTGCHACMRFAPTLAALKKEYEGRVRVEEVDTEKAKKVVFDYLIEGTPTVILFVKQKEFWRKINPKEAELRAALDKVASP